MRFIPADRLFVLTGAGISAESGLATFRGSGGLWNGHRVDQVATPEAWHADPALVWRFYSMRRRDAMAAEPNPAHRALATFHLTSRSALGGSCSSRRKCAKSPSHGCSFEICWRGKVTARGQKHALYELRRLQAENEWFLRRWLAIALAWLEEAPGRIWRSIACVLLLGWLVFGYAGFHGALVPTEAEAYKAFIAGSLPPSAYPMLSPFVYTLDNAVPLVKLGQDEKWAPDRRYPGTNWFTNYWFLMWTRWVLILFGWFQAGVLGTALLRRFKE